MEREPLTTPALPPRLSDEQIVTMAVLLEGTQVADGDPRLASIDDFMWCPVRFVTMMIPEAWLVEWPDGALGFAILSPESEIAERLIATYAAARASLELQVLQSLASAELASAH